MKNLGLRREQRPTMLCGWNETDELGVKREGEVDDSNLPQRWDVNKIVTIGQNPKHI